MLLLQACLLPGARWVVEGCGRIRQKLVAPLLREGLPDLMLGTPLYDRLALQTLDDDDGFGVGVPLSAFHG
jgi:hypothetical protein